MKFPILVTPNGDAPGMPHATSRVYMDVTSSTPHTVGMGRRYTSRSHIRFHSPIPGVTTESIRPYEAKLSIRNLVRECGFLIWVADVGVALDHPPEKVAESYWETIFEQISIRLAFCSNKSKVLFPVYAKLRVSTIRFRRCVRVSPQVILAGSVDRCAAVPTQCNFSTMTF